MKSGRSIQDVSREILRQQEAKADYLVATDRLHMDTWGDSPVIRVLDREGIDQIEPLEIQQTAHQQIGTYLDIPCKYYDRMLQRDPALLSYNINRWFQKEPEQKLLRTMDGKARAFLSNRYRRIDNLDIARVVLPIIGEMEGARFESCEITDDRMYLKVVNPRLQAEVVPGDIVQAGIMISNSETGLGAVNIQPLIYRLVCSNGMVVNEAGTRRAHIGRVNTTDVNFALYSQQTLDAEDRAFVLKIQDTVRAAVDEARFATVLERMRESKQAQLNTQDLPGLVKLAGSSFGILEEEGKGVLQHLIEDGDFTLYGLANAVTRFSQDVESYDRATKLEEIGYSVMTMSPLLFQKIGVLPLQGHGSRLFLHRVQQTEHTVRRQRIRELHAEVQVSQFRTWNPGDVLLLDSGGCPLLCEGQLDQLILASHSKYLHRPCLIDRIDQRAENLCKLRNRERQHLIAELQVRLLTFAKDSGTLADPVLYGLRQANHQPRRGLVRNSDLRLIPLFQRFLKMKLHTSVLCPRRHPGPVITWRSRPPGPWPGRCPDSRPAR